jgi:hypothetical protein
MNIEQALCQPPVFVLNPLIFLDFVSSTSSGDRTPREGL